MDKLDLGRLRIFVISVLWRASVSSRDFFKNVNLGPFEDIAKQIILDNVPLSDQFPFWMRRYSESDNAKGIIFAPMPTRLDGLRFYTLTMNGFTVWIKVDGQKLKPPLYNLWVALTNNGQILVYEKEFKGSAEYSATQKLVIAAASADAMRQKKT